MRIMRLGVMLLPLLGITEARADLFDAQTASAIAEVTGRTDVKTLKEVTVRELSQLPHGLPDAGSSVFLVMRTDDSHFAKLLVRVAQRKTSTGEPVELLLVERIVTYANASGRVLADRKDIHVYPGFGFDADLGQAVPIGMGDDFKLVSSDPKPASSLLGTEGQPRPRSVDAVKGTATKSDEKPADPTTKSNAVTPAAAGEMTTGGMAAQPSPGSTMKSSLIVSPLTKAFVLKGPLVAAAVAAANTPKPGPVQPDDFTGVYRLDADGKTAGELTLTVSEAGDVKGTFKSDGTGSTYEVAGTVTSPAHRIKFRINFPMTEQDFDGFLWTRGKMKLAGTTRMLDRQYGFVAERK